MTSSRYTVKVARRWLETVPQGGHSALPGISDPQHDQKMKHLQSLAAAKCRDLRPEACGKTFIGHNHNIYYILYIYGPAWWCYTLLWTSRLMLVINICLSVQGMHCIILTGNNFGA